MVEKLEFMILFVAYNLKIRKAGALLASASLLATQAALVEKFSFLHVAPSRL
ncbi:hypothetical protein [Chlorogloeopsis fritschii]|uniref:hypothetical protein n=1 Tax=Chlorogloeopsis fritschii TaxID=1124 RepID=UPI0023F39239|nr:hypothetical protein [Chlorogloeopsis fritschii]